MSFLDGIGFLLELLNLPSRSDKNKENDISVIGEKKYFFSNIQSFIYFVIIIAIVSILIVYILYNKLHSDI